MTARASDCGAIMSGACPPLESMDPSLREGVEVARDLGVDPATGLSAAQAARRLDTDGPNELESEPPVPLWRKIMSQFRDPFVYLLLAAASIALLAWVAEGAPGVPIDAVVIGAVIMLNAAIGFIQERRAENAVAALQAVTAARSTVLRDGALLTIPSSQLVCGDIMVLSEGDAVGADGRLLTATGLRMSEADLTGESEPVTKAPLRSARRPPSATERERYTGAPESRRAWVAPWSPARACPPRWAPSLRCSKPLRPSPVRCEGK